MKDSGWFDSNGISKMTVMSFRDAGWSFDPIQFGYIIYRSPFGIWNAINRKNPPYQCSIFRVKHNEYRFTVIKKKRFPVQKFTCIFVIPNSKVAESILLAPLHEWLEDAKENS